MEIRLPRSKTALSVDSNVDLKLSLEYNNESLFPDVVSDTLSLSQQYFDERAGSSKYHFYGNLRFNGPFTVDGTYTLLYRENPTDRYPCDREYVFYDDSELTPRTRLFNSFVPILAYPFSSTTIPLGGIQNLYNSGVNGTFESANGVLGHTMVTNPTCGQGQFWLLDSSTISNSGAKSMLFQTFDCDVQDASATIEADNDVIFQPNTTYTYEATIRVEPNWFTIDQGGSITLRVDGLTDGIVTVIDSFDVNNGPKGQWVKIKSTIQTGIDTVGKPTINFPSITANQNTPLCYIDDLQIYETPNEVDQKTNAIHIKHYKTITKAFDIRVFNMSISKDIYGAQTFGYSTINDIELGGYIDYLGRPLLEVAVLLIPLEEDLTVIQGYETHLNVTSKETNGQVPDLQYSKFYSNISSNVDYVDLNVTGNVFTNVSATIVSETLAETDVGESAVRMVTTITSDNNCSPNIPINNDLSAWRYEWYNKLQLKVLSLAYEEGNRSDSIVPSWAIDIDSSGNTRWRDILDVGVIENNQNGVDYPFSSGINYYSDNLDYFFYNEGDFRVDLLFDNTELVIDDSEILPPTDLNCPK